TVHRCSECGGESTRWLGRCPACDAWGTLVEAVDVARPTAGVRSGPVRAGAGAPRPLGDVRARVAGPGPPRGRQLHPGRAGGLVPGSVTLLAGEPGMGKSTLLLQALGRIAGAGTTCLLVTAEESCAQVRMRAERVGALAGDLLVVAETSLPHVLAHVDAVGP